MDEMLQLDNAYANLPFIEELYAKYTKNPASIDPSWQKFFNEIESDRVPYLSTSSLPSLSPEEVREKSVIYYPKLAFSSPGDLRIYHLIEAYRTYGHLLAKVNPISTHAVEEPHQLELETLGFTKKDLSNHFPTCGLLPEDTAPLLEIVNALKSIYCNKIGVEYMGMQSPELEMWLQEQIEPTRFQTDLSIDQKRMILDHLNRSELFEIFLHTKYVGQKRFSLEGGETLIPILATIIDTSALLGFEEFVLGMAHRGRLNVLSNILNKSYTDIFSEFEEGYIPASVEGSGDVKYHKGFYSSIRTEHGKEVKISLVPNPSHLESIDPVVEGQVKAKQVLRGDDINQEKVFPILIHGDAAISGQGIVYETLQLSQLPGYSTGGTIHIVINNHIGFTTLPKDGRSTRYCTDLARTFGAPVFHVNAEDPEGCVYVTNLAIELRQKFHCDVFIDLNCYRKYGHNEMDEPAFTQPLEYQVIRKKKSIREIYRDDLIHQSVLEKEMAESLEEEFKQALQQALKSTKIPKKEGGQIPKEEKEQPTFQTIETGVPIKTLQEIGERLAFVPENLTIHPKLTMLNQERLSMLNESPDARPIDWGMAELLAYGSLLWEGKHVRVSGQDSCRGTFSHRHALFMDQVEEQSYIPLKHLKSRQGRFDIYNSLLSEFAVLGFEYGYSTAYLEALILWEAQFGDFSNGAQVIIDQFIASGEQKWTQKSRLTLLLPHGYEGQGPEHSSARIERFLSLAGNYNMRIVHPTTPAQFFHLLRRQLKHPVPKPLIVFTPKALLRHASCVSRIGDLAQGAFYEVLDDTNPPSKKTKKLLFCSGRIYYDLIAERTKNEVEDIAIVRIEQLYPLNLESIKKVIENYKGVKEYYWVQEEPENMGAWYYIWPLLTSLLPKDMPLFYAGRERSASPAVGSHAMHKKEYAAIMNAVFGKKNEADFAITGQFKA